MKKKNLTEPTSLNGVAIMLQKLLISDTICSFDLSIYQRIKKENLRKKICFEQ